MAQIFVSHSQRDTKQKNFFCTVFASTNVQAKYEEIEAISQGKRTPEQIATDISVSNAVFVVLGENVEQLKHTRDWVTSESGIARGTNKDVWVFEAANGLSKVSVVIPYVQHYVRFEYTDGWLDYMRSIVVSYDDSHVLPAMAICAAAGGALTDSAQGAAIGSGLGFLWAKARQTRPSGIAISCPSCRSVYSLHLTQGVKAWRCPVCNKDLAFQQ